jgi:hypothetical protein
MAFSSCKALIDGILFEPTFHHEADRFDSGGIDHDAPSTTRLTPVKQACWTQHNTSCQPSIMTILSR